jgi:hypothetical protein
MVTLAYPNIKRDGPNERPLTAGSGAVGGSYFTSPLTNPIEYPLYRMSITP